MENKMAGNKTIDGLKIEKIVSMISNIPGIGIKRGTNHPYLAFTDGLRPCPIASSTHARRMLVPWLSKATGYSDKNQIYHSLRSGEWLPMGG